MSAGAARQPVPPSSAPLATVLHAHLPRHLARPGRVLGVLGLACLVGAAVPLVPTGMFLAGLAACLLITAVIVRPAIGAYVLFVVTPLIAGIDRGLVIPVLR